MTEQVVRRWECVSYCHCKSRKGHFVVDDDGTWVLHKELGLHIGRGSVEESGLGWNLYANTKATNRDLRAIAALLIAAADKLEAEPDAVDTRIEA